MVREGLPEAVASKLNLSLEERAMWQSGEAFLAEEAASAKAPGLQEAGDRGQERSCGAGGSDKGLLGHGERRLTHVAQSHSSVLQKVRE